LVLVLPQKVEVIIAETLLACYALDMATVVAIASVNNEPLATHVVKLRVVVRTTKPAAAHVRSFLEVSRESQKAISVAKVKDRAGPSSHRSPVVERRLFESDDVTAGVLPTALRKRASDTSHQQARSHQRRNLGMGCTCTCTCTCT
jgi:hypothetical protein